MAVSTAKTKGKLARRNENGSSNNLRPIDRLKNILSADSVQEQFKNVLGENAGAFVASIIDLYNTDANLRLCDPGKVVMEALKAASLKLPINKQLGFAWIVPYKDRNGEQIPTFQLGYKGYVQLALRTGAYRYINADVVYEGELVKRDRLTGEIEIDPEARTSDKVVGYFAFLETLNGFRKTIFMAVDEVRRHAERFSRSYKSPSSPWHTDFDSMALKTCLRKLISHYGIMSIELQRAYIEDSADVTGLADAAAEGEAQDYGDAIDVDYQVNDEPTAGEDPADDAEQQGLGV